MYVNEYLNIVNVCSWIFNRRKVTKNNLTVLRQKRPISKLSWKENKAHQILCKTNISNSLICTRTYQEMFVFLENLAWFVSLLPPFWHSGFCRIALYLCLNFALLPLKVNTWLNFQPRRFNLTRDTTNSIHLFRVCWNDHLLNYFPPMYLYGINTNILLWTFSRAEMWPSRIKY